MSRDAFAPFDGWQDTSEIKSEVERAFARGAGVRVETLRRAMRRIVADGYHGPFDDRAWQDSQGYSMPMSRAIAIVRRAQDDARLPDVSLTHPDQGHVCEGADSCSHDDHRELADDGPLFHEEPTELGRRELIEWYFRELKPIYGTVYL